MAGRSPQTTQRAHSRLAYSPSPAADLPVGGDSDEKPDSVEQPSPGWQKLDKALGSPGSGLALVSDPSGPSGRSWPAGVGPPSPGQEGVGFGTERPPRVVSVSSMLKRQHQDASEEARTELGLAKENWQQPKMLKRPRYSGVAFDPPASGASDASGASGASGQPAVELSAQQQRVVHEVAAGRNIFFTGNCLPGRFLPGGPVPFLLPVLHD